MTGDNRYEEILSSSGKGDIQNMCDVAERLENKGRAEGRVQGRAEGEDKMSMLINKLIAAGRNDDVAKAAADRAERNKLYAEFGIE